MARYLGSALARKFKNTAGACVRAAISQTVRTVCCCVWLMSATGEDPRASTPRTLVAREERRARATAAPWLCLRASQPDADRRRRVFRSDRDPTALRNHTSAQSSRPRIPDQNKGFVLLRIQF